MASVSGAPWNWLEGGRAPCFFSSSLSCTSHYRLSFPFSSLVLKISLKVTTTQIQFASALHWRKFSQVSPGGQYENPPSSKKETVSPKDWILRPFSQISLAWGRHSPALPSLHLKPTFHFNSPKHTPHFSEIELGFEDCNCCRYRHQYGLSFFPLLDFLIYFYFFKHF